VQNLDGLDAETRNPVRLVSHERNFWDYNPNKAEVLAALRCLHDEVVDGPPLAGVSTRN